MWKGEGGKKRQDRQFVPNIPGAFPFYGAHSKTIAELDIGSLPIPFSALYPKTTSLRRNYLPHLKRFIEASDY